MPAATSAPISTVAAPKVPTQRQTAPDEVLWARTIQLWKRRAHASTSVDVLLT